MNLSESQVKEIIERMEILIAQKRMKKKEFYEKSGISSSLYSQWNTGAVKPSMRFLAQAADVLDVSIEFLTTGKEKTPSGDGEREIGFDDFTYAMHDHSGDLTDQDKEILLQMARQLAAANRRKPKDGETD